MAKLVFGMNQSLDGYIDHMALPIPSTILFLHFVEQAQKQTGSIYGRIMYETMCYWDDDHPEWDAHRHAFAAAWRKQKKWLISSTLKAVGPNAKLIDGDIKHAIQTIKDECHGEIQVAGPTLAHGLTELGLIDEYRIYVHPVVLGHGKAFFAGWRSPLRLVDHEVVSERGYSR